MDRRQFLRSTTFFSGGLLVSLGSQGWIFKTLAQPSPQRLIVIFLRGAIDGLNVVIPYTEDEYYAARPTIAIPRPGQSGGALDLNGQFGLHPSLEPLMAQWRDRRLAFVHASGSPDQTRSHFDAQDYMESGTPGRKNTTDGWMNRLLTALPGRSPTKAVNLGETVPRILAGSNSVASIAPTGNTGRPLPIDRPLISQAFDQLYQGNDAISLAYQEGREARETLMKNLEGEMMQADRGAPNARGFAETTRRVARLMERDASIQTVFLAIGGWDTHVNQGGSQGQLAFRLRYLGQGLATLATELGAGYRNTTILVLSEFGRTIQENGNRGTDHGHGNVIWLLGGRVKGGQVYGQWPGLEANQRFEGRDLAVTTDFRSVVSSVLQTQWRLDQPTLARIFPGFSLTTPLNLLS